jgi:hypothetical protein
MLEANGSKIMCPLRFQKTHLGMSPVFPFPASASELIWLDSQLAGRFLEALKSRSLY